MRIYGPLLQLVVVFSGGAAGAAFAQNGLVASPAAAHTTFDSDLQKLVDAAYPAYDDAALTKRLSDAARTLAARPDALTVRTLAGIEALMGFRPQTAPGRSEIDTAAAYYRVNPLLGKAFGHHKRDAYLGMERPRFQAIEAQIVSAQRGFLGKLGLPADELMKVAFHKVMVQSTDDGAANNSDGTPALVRRGTTLAYRGLGGFPIEGSAARLSSYDAGRIETFSLSWPKFQLHPQVSSIALDTAAAVKRGIVERLRAAVPTGDKVAVYMGVVFRQARLADGRLVHLPAMKVVLTPLAKRHAGASGETQTDAGLEFYAKILRNEPALPSDDAGDPVSGAR